MPAKKTIKKPAIKMTPIKKTTAKKSKSKSTKRPAALQKTKIRKRTENTGFFARITIKAERSVNVAKTEKSVVSVIHKPFFQIS